MKALGFVLFGGILLFLLDRIFGYGSEAMIGYGYMMEMDWMILYVFLYLMVIVAPILFLLMVAYRNGGKISPNNQEKIRLDILKARYAKGEISEEEFDIQKKSLFESH